MKTSMTIKKPTKNECYGNSILLLGSICEVENKYYPQTFLDEIFKIHKDNNINKLFNELVQIINWSDDESNDLFE